MTTLKLRGTVRDVFSKKWAMNEGRVNEHPEPPVNPEAWFLKDQYRLPKQPRQKTKFQNRGDELAMEVHDFNRRHKYSSLVVSFNAGSITTAAIPEDMDMIRSALEHLNGTVECEIEQHEEGHWFVTKLNPTQGLS